MPWSGSALGLVDLANLVPRGRPIVIGVVGAHDSGKTTLLTGSYLQLLRGRTLGNAHFAGSRSLGAWESLAAWMRFDDAARPPSFPPHTPRGTTRVPGLLHLALRGHAGEHRDLLLTDAPGEWFTRWATREQAPDAAGARWVAQHADAFLVLADCQRLVGPERGAARQVVRELIERLGHRAGHRPTVLVWSKDDYQPLGAAREAIRAALRESLPHATEASTSASRPASLLSPLEEALRTAWSPPAAAPIEEPVVGHLPFAAFRGANAHA